MPGKTKKAAEAADKQEVAFAEGGKGAEYSSTCHGCGRKCKGGWRKRPHITEEHRAKVAARDAAGHFRRGNNNNSNNGNKKGTANVATDSRKGDNNDASRDGASKSGDGSTSELTKNMTIGEQLKLTGIVNTTIEMTRWIARFMKRRWRYPGQHRRKFLSSLRREARKGHGS